jgi:outer membrane protein
MLFLALLVSVPAWAGERLDLLKAANLALEHAPAFAAAKAGRDASLEDVALARAYLLPYVQGSGSFSRFHQNFGYTQPLPFFPPNVDYNRSRAGIELIQPLFHLDRWAGYEQGRLSSEVGEISLSLARQALFLETAGAYVDVLVAREELMSARAQARAVERLHQQARAAFEAGTAMINDALEAKSRLDLVHSSVIRAENRLNTARARFTSLTGAAAENLLTFSDDFKPAMPQPDDVSQWEEKAEQRSKSVLLAEKEFAIAREEVRKAFGLVVPSVDLVAGYDWEKSTASQFGTGVTARTGRIGIQVEVPIYAGGGSLAQQRKTRKLQDQTQYRLADTPRQPRLAPREALLNIKAAVAQVHASAQALLSAKKARKAAGIGYEVGLRTIVEFLDVEDRLALARRDLVSARGAYLLARLQLAASVGDLSLDELGRMSALLTREQGL